MKEIVQTIAEHPLASGVYGMFLIVLANIAREAIIGIAMAITGTWKDDQTEEEENRNE